MKVRWSAEARADRRRIRSWIARDNRRAALELDRLFRDRAAQLVAHPAMGRPGRLRGTRELLVHPNYILVYRPETEAVLVIAVVHASRNWPPEEPDESAP